MEKGDIFTPSNDEQVTRMAMIHALRANTDAMERIARHSEVQDQKLDGITTCLGQIDKRLALLERDPLRLDVERNRRDIDTLDQRLNFLEAESYRRKGAWGFADGIVKYGPLLAIVATAFFIILIASGRIVL